MKASTSGTLFKYELQFTVLRRIFGPEKEEVTAGWRKLHSEEQHDVYCLPNIIVFMYPYVRRFRSGQPKAGFFPNHFAGIR
jgi:hypothetical protein